MGGYELSDTTRTFQVFASDQGFVVASRAGRSPAWRVTLEPEALGKPSIEAGQDDVTLAYGESALVARAARSEVRLSWKILAVDAGAAPVGTYRWTLSLVLGGSLSPRLGPDGRSVELFRETGSDASPLPVLVLAAPSISGEAGEKATARWEIGGERGSRGTTILLFVDGPADLEAPVAIQTTIAPAAGADELGGPHPRGARYTIAPEFAAAGMDAGVMTVVPLSAPPPEIGDSVRLSISGGVATISWDDPPGPYNIYRGYRRPGTVWSYDQYWLAANLSASSTNDAANPAPGQLFYYLVSRVDGTGTESLLGQSSGGTTVPNPSAAPISAHLVPPSKPYFMIGLSTDGAMATAVAGAPSCGYPSTRIGVARCALANTVRSNAGMVNFGLASFATAMSGCGATCYTGCTFSNLPGNSGPAGCGPEPNPTAPNSSSRAGANIVAPLRQDDFWDSPPAASNLTQMLSWLDNDCTGSIEMFAAQSTPQNGLLRDIYRYLSNQWTHPSGAPTYLSPLASPAVGERACRTVSTILIVDSDENCDTQADAIDAAAALYAGFTKDGVLWKVKTYVIGLAGGILTNQNLLAAAGGTGTAYSVANEADMSAALQNIIGANLQPEVCDNVDNNCNGLVDEGFEHFRDVPVDAARCCTGDRATCLTNYRASITPAVPEGDPRLLPCTTESQQADPAAGLCQDPGETCDGIDNNGQRGIDENVVVCGNPPHCPATEVCNGLDDDCDGIVDNGNVCGACVASPEICDGCDNDCDGIADDGAPAVACGRTTPGWCPGTMACHPPQAVPVGGCVAGSPFQACSNAPRPEICDGIDNDCNGVIDDGDVCPCAQRPEICNGLDDNCNGEIDEGVTPPLAKEVCGVSPSARNFECTSGVSVACQGGAWVCQFFPGVCTGGDCAATAEICDGFDNNCNGQIDENVAWIGQTCASDDGLPPPGHGRCRTFGTRVCNGPSASRCSAVKADCALLPGGCDEACDGVDNDCDGLIDEPFSNKGSNATYFVKPAVTKIGASSWIYSYEASRPSATDVMPGAGDGYTLSVPSGPRPGTTFDKTPACSVPGRIPWFNVQGLEAEQICTAAGGFLCSLAQWQSACTTTAVPLCRWGYSPRGTDCTSGFTASKFCNLAPSFDSASAAGDQDTLLPAHAPGLAACWADWSGLAGNPTTDDKIYDMTGNLRELAKVSANVYDLMGGSYRTESEPGSTCQFTFSAVDPFFELQDAGFRCCFSVDPRQ